MISVSHSSGLLSVARRQSRNTVAVAGFCCLLSFGFVGQAQAQEADDTAAEEATELDSEQTMREIDDILLGDLDVWADRDRTYDAEGRRDPFRSLIERRQQGLPSGPRPSGIPGLLIEEIDLTGLFQTPTGAVAQIQAAVDDRSYLLSVGDQLFDGDVISISSSEVVFKQILDDPTELKPFREVVKKLYPEEDS